MRAKDGVPIGKLDGNGKATAAVVAAAVLMALQPVLMTLAKNPETHTFDYSIPAAVMLQELLKLSLSLCLLAEDRLRTGKQILHSGSLRELCLYFIPSVVYAFNNNFVYFTLLYLTPVVFQLLSQLKTVFTGVLFWLILQRQLAAMQWLALVVLACGTASSQLSSSTCDEQGADLLPDTWIGLLLAVASSANSAFAGVYNEKLLKGRPESSVHWQNAQMYIWGVALNGAKFVLDARNMAQLSRGGLLGGFNGWACAAVLCNALMGISIGFVLKFANNIARVYAHGIAMLVTLLITWQLFGTPITMQVTISMVLVVSSTIQYTVGGAPPRPAATPGSASLH